MKVESSAKIYQVFVINGLFSLSCGILLMFFAENLAGYIGFSGQVGLLQLLGVGLAMFAGRLLYLAKVKNVLKPEALLIIASDFTWVIGTVVLSFALPNGLNATGWLISFIIAGIVFLFGLLQAFSLKQSFTPNMS